MYNTDSDYYERHLCCALLHIESGFDTPVNNFPFTIGRSTQCHLHIVKKSVSRVHAVISKDKQGLSISNISAINHVKINHQKIDRCLLVEGDLVSIAGERYRYHENMHAEPVSAVVNNTLKLRPSMKLLLLVTLVLVMLVFVIVPSSYKTIEPVAVKSTISLPDLPVVAEHIYIQKVVPEPELLIEKKQQVAMPIAKHAKDKSPASKSKPLPLLYQQGLSAYRQGREEMAFALWSSYLNKENQSPSKHSNELSMNIKKFVIEAYTRRAHQAIKHGDKSNAYSLWQKIIRIDPDHKAQIALNELDAFYQSLVSKAAMSDRAGSIHIWKLLADSTPAAHFLHHRALAKISVLKMNNEKPNEY